MGASSSSGSSSSYWADSHRPIVALTFILPMLVIHEFGSHLLASVTGGESRIVAFTLLRDTLYQLGATGRLLPAALVVVVLLSWHVHKGDRWKCRLSTLSGMTLESFLLALPLFVCGIAVASWLPRFLPQAPAALATGPVDPHWLRMIVLSFGAGIYEELVFRLLGFAALHALLFDLFGLPRKTAGTLTVITSAVLFSLYHYIGPEQFEWGSFVFRTLAGVWFGACYLLRGFGVAVGCHAMYDVIVVSLPYLIPPVEG